MLDTMRRGDIYKEVAHPLQDAKIYHQPNATSQPSHSTTDTIQTSKTPAAAGH
jgi:hypothetical protein